jgi:hypothetical protein
MAVNPDVVFGLSAFLVTTLTQTLVVSYLDDYVCYVTKALGLVGDAVSPSLIVLTFNLLNVCRVVMQTLGHFLTATNFSL